MENNIVTDIELDDELDASTEELVIADFFDADEYSPYMLHKKVNEILDALGLKNIVPQMMYQYVAKGMIKASGAKGEKGRLVTKEHAIEWTEKYVAKKLSA